MEFEFFSGFARSQKEKSINSLLKSAEIKFKSDKILEISKASPNPLGIALSAFNLMLCIKDKNQNLIKSSVERFFQGAKFFENGGPFSGIIFDKNIHPKKFPPLKNSGNFRGFKLFDLEFPTEPKTFFYDFLYISALCQNVNLVNDILEYKYFSDIEFNPKKSFLAQSRAVALFVGLRRSGIFDENFANQEKFFDFYTKNLTYKNLF